MADAFDHACRCGQTRLRIAVPSRRAGSRLVCYCRDCRTSAHLCVDPAALMTPQGGADIWHTTPDRVAVLSGAEHLEIRRLSPRGLYRWAATCCDTPMLNTLERLGFPFAGLVLRPDQASAADRTFGPAMVQANTSGALRGRGAPARDRNVFRAGAALMIRALSAVLSGRAAQNPLRDPSGAAIAPVRLIDRDLRDAARAAAS